MADKTAAPQIYGADEINAVVLDPGSYTTQLGYAGYDQPQIVTPSYYGTFEDNKEEKCFDENLLFSNYKPGLEVKPILSNDMIVDWEGAISQYKNLFNKLEIIPQEQPLLFTEPTFNSYKNKVKSMEYFFEEEQFCAFYAVKQPTCVSFAHGRPNCLVVDVGHDLLTITPVIDGLCLNSQVKITNYAGAYLNQQLKQFLELKSISYLAPFQVRNKIGVFWEDNSSVAKFDKVLKDVNQSLVDFSYLRTLREMKELLLECCNEDEIIKSVNLDKNDGNNGNNKDIEMEKENYEDDSTRWFELPNGLNVPFTLYERQKIANSIFTPGTLIEGEDIVKGWEVSNATGDLKNIVNLKESGAVKSKEYVPLRRNNNKKPEDETEDDANSANTGDNKTTDENDNSNSNGNSNHVKKVEPIGIVNLVQKVLDNLDIDLKPQLANNIVLTGSTSLIPRLNERLNNDLTINNPSLKIRIHSAGNTTERKYSSWIGGSILSSLGTFHQLWVSKAEYEEVGSDHLIINRFR